MAQMSFVRAVTAMTLSLVLSHIVVMLLTGKHRELTSGVRAFVDWLNEPPREYDVQEARRWERRLQQRQEKQRQRQEKQRQRELQRQEKQRQRELQRQEKQRKQHREREHMQRWRPEAERCDRPEQPPEEPPAPVGIDSYDNYHAF